MAVSFVLNELNFFILYSIYIINWFNHNGWDYTTQKISWCRSRGTFISPNPALKCGLYSTLITCVRERMTTSFSTILSEFNQKRDFGVALKCEYVSEHRQLLSATHERKVLQVIYYEWNIWKKKWKSKWPIHKYIKTETKKCKTTKKCHFNRISVENCIWLN